MARDGSPYCGPVPRPTVVKPNRPCGPVRSATAPCEGVASMVNINPTAGVANQMRRRIKGLLGHANAAFAAGSRNPAPFRQECPVSHPLKLDGTGGVHVVVAEQRV